MRKQQKRRKLNQLKFHNKGRTPTTAPLLHQIGGNL